MSRCGPKPFTHSTGPLLILATALMAGAAHAGSPEAQVPKDSQEKLRQVLGAPEIWGKDFPAALTAIESWRQAGETTVAVFADKMVGEKPYANRDEARAASDRLRKALAAVQLQPRDNLPGDLLRKLSGARKELSRFRTEGQAFWEDDSYHVVLSAPAAQFLAPGLTMEKVRERLGPPAEIRAVAIQSQGDRRPVILTLNIYLGGAVAFAETDIAPRPGFVDRVLLDSKGLSEALFGGAQ